MRISKLVTRILRDDPPEAETASQRLMLRVGLIRQVAAGVYAYLPLAWRSLRKIEQIIREERNYRPIGSSATPNNRNPSRATIQPRCSRRWHDGQHKSGQA